MTMRPPFPEGKRHRESQGVSASPVVAVTPVTDSTGHEHAHFVASATAGLHVAIRILKDRLGWRENEGVITTPLTFVSTNHAILYERLRPVFADIDDSLCLDPDSVAERITPRTRAVVF